MPSVEPVFNIKEAILFHLRRALRDREERAELPDMVGMASAGVSYEERIASLTVAEKNQAELSREIECFRKAIEIIEAHKF